MSEQTSQPGPGGRDLRILALSGGIGGAKLALGLYKYLLPNRLSVLCNPGDDFEHLGLTIWPDFDTVLYTLAGLSDRSRGWGLANESWGFMEMLQRLDGPDWFQLGDRDLALHIERTRFLSNGGSPAAFAKRVSAQLGVEADLLVCAEQPIRTIVETETGKLGFQEYFVRDQCAPIISGFEFNGADCARVNPNVLQCLQDPTLDGIVICPSNPYISVDPILSLAPIREAILSSAAPVVAVSPIVGGQALKGPTAKMMQELGFEVSARAVAAHYATIIDGFIIDHVDSELATELDIVTRVENTVMQTLDDRVQLAHHVCELICDLKHGVA